MDSLLVFMVVVFLVTVNGLYVAAEFSIVGVSRASVDRLAGEGHRAARVLQKILGRPRNQDRYIAATQLGVTLASLGLGMYGEHALAKGLAAQLEGLGSAQWISAHAVASILAVAFLTYLHVVVGEMVPKTIALARPRATVFFTLPFALATRGLLLPLVLTVEFLSHRLLRLVGIDRSKASESHEYTEEDLAQIVEESRKKGKLPPEAGKLLVEMFDFRHLNADDVMVPRVSMHALPLGALAAEIAKVVGEGQHTRYPVHDGNLDHIIGMAHMKDLLRILREGGTLHMKQVRPITFVPETMSLDRVLEAMRRNRTHVVIVMDEQGGTAGMLTVKDLFEELVGTFEEGAVETEGRMEVYRDAQGRLHVAGTLRLDELGEVLKRRLPEIEAETVSGLVLLQLGRPAELGDMVEHAGLRLVVVEVEGRGVKECLVQGATEV